MRKRITYANQAIKDIWEIFTEELKKIFTDTGVILIFFVAGALYPLLYNVIYPEEYIYDVPVAVVDECGSYTSREFTRNVDATREAAVMYRCTTIEEARRLMETRTVHGIIYFPSDFDRCMAENRTATISLYSDMSSFLYYKNILSAANAVMLQEMHDIQIRRYSLTGRTGEDAEQLVQAIPYEEKFLFSPGGGYASFLVPSVLVLIITQTLLLGVALLQGTAREDNMGGSVIPARMRGRGIYRVVFGQGMAYFSVYAILTSYVLILVPRFFNLPHIGDIGTIYRFMIPFLLASIFFAMTIGLFMKHREDGIIVIAPFNIMLIFLAGVSWPGSNMPEFWKLFSWLFPSTHGVQGFVAMNTMGAGIYQIEFQYVSLWLLAGFYFITTILGTYFIERKNRSLAELRSLLRTPR